MPNEENPNGFVRTKLPWIAAGGSLVLFLVTLNHWVNLRSLPIVARITGWDWTMPTQSPLLFLLTYPFRLLPAGIQPVGLNLFSAVCAALTLGLLARSVALLPHDRTHEQRIRERSEFSLLSFKLAWVPPLLAVLVCALELTFWENATALTGEALDLLLFAYVIRCLLEFRVSRNDRWLSKMALVYGLGVTNNWAFIGFFPLFLAALVWIKGVRFFDPGFLVKMTLLGIAGLLLYLLLPVVWAAKSTENVSFFQVLKANWVQQKFFLVDMKALRNRALLIGLVSVLPVILMGIRWPSSFGDTSAAGATMTNLAFRVIHLFFLGACIFAAFDTKYSPRQLGMGLPFLTFYYLAALAIGYYSGYALLVFRNTPRKGWRRDDAFGKVFNPIVQGAVLLTLVVVPSALAYRNYAAVQAGNGTILREYANQTIKALPPKPAYLLSEDVYQLGLVEATLESSKTKNDYVFVNTRSLETPGYHLQMKKRYGARWPDVVDPKDVPPRVEQVEIQQMVRGLAASNLVVYLHPSFGYFYDVMYAEPHGLTYTMKDYGPEQVLPPPLGAEELQANRAAWQKTEEILPRIEAVQKFDSPDAHYLKERYSRAVNAWGVTLQRAGEAKDAGRQFAHALQLNTNNAAAKLNLDFNEEIVAGKSSGALDLSKSDALLGSYTSWDQLLAENGPLDRPDFCFFLGATFLGTALYRQAAFQFSRAMTFQPTNYSARIGYAKALIFGGWPDRGLAEVDKIESELKTSAERNFAEVAAVRAAGYFGQTNLARAEATLKSARAQHPENGALAESLLELYRAAGDYTNALALVEEQIAKHPTNLVARLQKAELQMGRENYEGTHATLESVLALAPGNMAAQLFDAFAYLQQKKFEPALSRIDHVLQMSPDNVQALIYKGVAHMEQKQYDKASDAFEAALRKEPKNVAVLRNRAILNLRRERWADAKDDYEQLRRVSPKSHAVYYGLGEVAYNQKDFDAAQRYYETYLKHAPSGGTTELEEEKKKVEARLREIALAKK